MAADTPSDLGGALETELVRTAFRATLIKYVNDAKASLVETDGLTQVVLLGSQSELFQLEIGPVPPAVAKKLLRDLCATHPDIYYVFHVAMGYTLSVEDESKLVPRDDIPEHKDRRLQLIVHGLHRDFGLMAAHVTVTRKAPKQFEFGEIEWPDPTMLREQLLTDLWPKRRLNS